MSDFRVNSGNLLRPGATASDASPKTNQQELENSPAGRKLLKAARDFEADLISSWWQEAEKDLHDSSSGALGSGFDGLKGLAMNTLAESMVKGGGLGIARMVFHSLAPALERKLRQETSASAPEGATFPEKTANTLEDI